MRHRLLAFVLAILLLVPFTPVAHADRPDSYPYLHPDVTVSANGEVLSTGSEIALDGGMAHAGTGLTLTFQACGSTAAHRTQPVEQGDVRDGFGRWHRTGWLMLRTAVCVRGGVMIRVIVAPADEGIVAG
jgi:hypothetical protein